MGPYMTSQVYVSSFEFDITYFQSKIFLKIQNLQKLLRESERQFAFGHDFLHCDVSGQSGVKPVRLQDRVREEEGQIAVLGEARARLCC